jgi:glycine cleavage system aminomethyltransferase T
MPVLWQPPTPLGRPRPGQITVTSACHSPHLDTVLGLGFVRADDLAAGRAVADPSGVFTRLCLVPRPAIDPGKVRPRAPWPAPGVRP